MSHTSPNPKGTHMNWDKELTDKLVSAYDGDNDKLKAIATDLGVTVAAVRGKLVSLGKYVKTEPPKRIVADRKAMLVASIASITGIDNLDSLEKASKADLLKFLDWLKANA